VRARDGAGRPGPPARVCPDPAGVALVAHQFACEARCVEGRLTAGEGRGRAAPFDETPPACVGRFTLDASVAAALRADHHARAADAPADATGGADAAEPPTREQAGCDGCAIQARGRARGAYGAWALAALLLRRRRARGG
jgi:hypothetical protein